MEGALNSAPRGASRVENSTRSTGLSICGARPRRCETIPSRARRSASATAEACPSRAIPSAAALSLPSARPPDHPSPDGVRPYTDLPRFGSFRPRSSPRRSDAKSRPNAHLRADRPAGTSLAQERRQEAAMQVVVEVATALSGVALGVVAGRLLLGGALDRRVPQEPHVDRNRVYWSGAATRTMRAPVGRPQPHSLFLVDRHDRVAGGRLAGSQDDRVSRDGQRGLRLRPAAERAPRAAPAARARARAGRRRGDARRPPPRTLARRRRAGSLASAVLEDVAQRRRRHGRGRRARSRTGRGTRARSATVSVASGPPIVRSR